MKRLLIAVPFWVAIMSASTINPAIEYSSAATLNDTWAYTLGYQFTTSVALSINALGYWDDGLGNNHQVGIWNSDGTLLLSTTVRGSDPLMGHFLYDPISPFSLAAGTYVIGGEFLGNGDPFTRNPTGVHAMPGYTWDEDRQIAGSGLVFPTESTNGYGPNGILVVDFSVASAELANPEPATVVLMLSAMLVGARFRSSGRVR